MLPDPSVDGPARKTARKVEMLPPVGDQRYASRRDNDVGQSAARASKCLYICPPRRCWAFKTLHSLRAWVKDS